MRTKLQLMALMGVGTILASCATTGITSGSGGSLKTSSAAGSSSANASVYRCPKTLGTIAVDDGETSEWGQRFRSETGVKSVEPMIRLIVQQSNCFKVVSTGNKALNSKLQAIMSDQRNSGETKAGSNLQKGQRTATDYFLEPTIQYASSDGGAVGAMAGALGGWGGALIGGAMKKKHTSVNLSIFSVRSAEQLVASNGSASVNEFGGGVGGFAGLGGAMGGYTKTPEGKALVAAFVDAYNSMVVALQNYEKQTIEGGSGTGGLLEN